MLIDFSDVRTHPLSLDVFENYLYWVAGKTGQLMKQDKFGRGVPVIIAKDLVNPSSVKGNQIKITIFVILYLPKSKNFILQKSSHTNIDK